MKKLLAILFLSVYLFNAAGYSLLFQYRMYQSDQQLAEQIDAGNYERSELTIVKLPVHLPYYNDWKHFERIDGQIEIDGVFYTYVEKKLSRDTLYLACLPNEKKMALHKAKSDYGRTVNALPQSQKKNTATAFKKDAPGIENKLVPFRFTSQSLPIISLNNVFSSADKPVAGFLSIPFTPPDLA